MLQLDGDLFNHEITLYSQGTLHARKFKLIYLFSIQRLAVTQKDRVSDIIRCS